MLFKKCVYCFKLVSYALHLLCGVKQCVGCEETPTLKQLHQIEMSLDHSVDACEDFYGYACNNWAEQHQTTKYDEITGLLDYQLNVKLINLIEHAYQYPLASKQRGCQNFVEKTRNYYKSCLNEKTRNITRYFDHIKPGPGLEWPILEELRAYQRGDNNFQLKEWPEHKFDIFALLGQLQSYGLNNVLLALEMARTQNGSLQIMLEVPYVAESEVIPPELLMVLLTGWGLSKTTADKYMKRIMNAENNWLKLYQKYAETYDDEPLKLTYLELKENYGQISTFLENIIPQQIQDSDFIVLPNRQYIQFLLDRSWQPKTAQNISNYLMLKFLIHMIQDTTNDFTKLDCIKDLRKKMDLAVNYLYYDRIYRKDDWQLHQIVRPLTREIYKYFVATLHENPLNLDSTQLQQLLDKLSTLTVNLGNLPQANTSYIEQFYQDVPALDRGNYYVNHLHLLRHRFLKSLVYPQNQSFFIATDNKVGSSSAPIYITKQHMVILPLGFLQQPVYDQEYDPIFLWSMLGFLLAHEYTHAIDTTGLQFGTDGLLLSNDSGILEQSNFSDAVNCLLEQEPTDAIDERLADIVGARVAYKAYMHKYNWQLQPGFSAIPWKQLFFLNLSQFFCGRKGVEFENHDTDAVRLQQIVMNLEGFSEAYQCPLGSRMNPVKKCRVY